MRHFTSRAWVFFWGAAQRRYQSSQTNLGDMAAELMVAFSSDPNPHLLYADLTAIWSIMAWSIGMKTNTSTGFV